VTMIFHPAKLGFVSMIRKAQFGRLWVCIRSVTNCICYSNAIGNIQAYMPFCQSDTVHLILRDTHYYRRNVPAQ